MGTKKNTEKTFKFMIYLVVVILLNLAAVTLFFRVDLTSQKLYSLSAASKKAVSTLSEPLTIKVFFTKNLPAPHNTTERYLRDLLEEYSIYANKYFNYTFYDVSPKEGGELTAKARENQKLASDYGISPVQIQVIEKDEVKFQKAYMGLVLIHGDLIERIPTITSTDGLEYRLTTAILKLNNKVSALLRLPEKIHVKLFLSSSLNVVAPRINLKKLPDLPKELKAIVDRLKDKTYGKVDFVAFDPSQKAELEKEADRYHITKLQWPQLDNGKIPAGHGYIGLVMEYQDRVVDIPILHAIRLPLIGTRYQLADLSKMEQVLSDNLETLIDINQDLGYLADKGTLPLYGAPNPMNPQAQGLTEFNGLASQIYSVKNVDLEKGDIPDSIDCLVIARPTQKFSDYDLFKIDQFLMKGKSLALFVDAFQEIMPPGTQAMGGTPRYVPLHTGLEKLLEHYGIRIKTSYVLDENCYRQQIPSQFGGGERPIYFAPLIKNRYINHDLPIMKNIKGLVVFQASPLELDRDRIKKNGLKAIRLFSSSDKSWEMTGRINLNPMFIRPPKSDQDMESRPLAYLIEGEFPSYFAGKPLPEKPEDKSKKKDKKATKKTEGSKDQAKQAKSDGTKSDLAKIKGERIFIEKGKPGKIFLIGSSYMLRNNLLDEQGRDPNSIFVMNIVDYLNGRQDIALMRSKQQRFNPLNETSPTVKTVIKAVNIVGLPLLVVLMGLFVWLRRTARKRRIQMMFQK